MRSIAIILVICTFSAIAHACPFCADTIHNTDASSASTLGSAMNLSIYCMFMGLFVAFGIVLRAVMKGIRNQ
jgi:hypothetical protein